MGYSKYMMFTVHQVPPRGLITHDLYEVRDRRDRLVMTCESRPLADRWATRLSAEFSK